FTARDSTITYHIKIGPGEMDRSREEDEVAEDLLGIYVLDGNQLRLHFGSKKGARPKNPKEAWETWTLVRPSTRQQIYQKLDQLQGDWKAIAGPGLPCLFGIFG